jgi:hypothetical protein
MIQGRRELFLAAIVSVICWLTMIAGAPPVALIPAAIVFLFVLPGYALLKSLGLAGSLEIVEEMCLTLGASCAVAIVVAVAIGLFSSELRGPVFAAVLEVIILVGLGLAAVRADHPATSSSLTSKSVGASVSGLKVRRLIVPIVLWLTAGLLVGDSLIVASQPALGPDVVQLWMISQGESANVGVSNLSTDAETYRVTIGPRCNCSQYVVITINVTVGAGGTWGKSVQFPTTWPAATDVIAYLYRDGDTSPYRVAWVTPFATATK